MKRVKWPFGPKKISTVSALPGETVCVTWEDGTTSRVNLGSWIESGHMEPLRDPDLFAKASVNDYGSAVVFIEDDIEIDSIHLQLLESEQRGAPLLPDGLRRWRDKHHLTQAQAARELGVSPRQWQNYESGATFLPWTLALACAGWEAVRSRAA